LEKAGQGLLSDKERPLDQRKQVMTTFLEVKIVMKGCGEKNVCDSLFRT
jgi:hypothetical protein